MSFEKHQPISDKRNFNKIDLKSPSSINELIKSTENTPAGKILHKSALKLIKLRSPQEKILDLKKPVKFEILIQVLIEIYVERIPREKKYFIKMADDLVPNDNGIFKILQILMHDLAKISVEQTNAKENLTSLKKFFIDYITLAKKLFLRNKFDNTYYHEKAQEEDEKEEDEKNKKSDQDDNDDDDYYDDEDNANV